MDNSIPIIPSEGVRKQFPSIPTYLKNYPVFESWQEDLLPLLELYGDEGPLSQKDVPDSSDDFVFAYYQAANHLQRISFSLRGHALKVALAVAAAPKKKKAPAPLDAASAAIEFEKQTRFKSYLGAMVGAKYDYLSKEADAKDRAEIEEKIALMDSAIAFALAMLGYTSDDIEHALLVGSPHMALRHGENSQGYAAQTAERAASDPRVTVWRAKEQRGLMAIEAFDLVTAANWQAIWERSVAYSYWRSQIEMFTRHPNFSSTVRTVANCLILGWQKMGLFLARRAIWAVEAPAFSLIGDSKNHTRYFVLDLIINWQSWKTLDRNLVPRFKKKLPESEPLFDALLAHWRTPDPAAIAPLLLAACDRRTHQCRFLSNSCSDPELSDLEEWYDPFEILLVLKLRSILGLENPVLDHPIMATSLGKLPAETVPYSDALLEKVVAQARKELPTL